MSNPTVTVYTTGPQCQKCNLTKQALDKAGLDYTEVRLDHDPDLADQLRENGYAIAPVVEARKPGGGVDRWSDFRPDRIKALAKAVA